MIFGTNSFEISSKKMSEGERKEEAERERELKSAPEITLNGDRWRITKKDEGFEKMEGRDEKSMMNELKLFLRFL